MHYVFCSVSYEVLYIVWAKFSVPIGQFWEVNIALIREPGVTCGLLPSHTHTHTRTRTHAHTHTHTYTHTHTRIRTHIHMCTHTVLQTPTHTQSFKNEARERESALEAKFSDFTSLGRDTVELNGM